MEAEQNNKVNLMSHISSKFEPSIAFKRKLLMMIL